MEAASAVPEPVMISSRNARISTMCFFIDETIPSCNSLFLPVFQLYCQIPFLILCSSFPLLSRRCSGMSAFAAAGLAV
jgi:hypothetical protein